MSITLNDVRMNTNDTMVAGVIDEFRRSNYLLSEMAFDDAVTAGAAGAAPSYSYYRITTPASAAFRSIGSEYTAGNAVKQKVTVGLKAFGGSYTIDRVLAGEGNLVDEVELQTRQMVKAAQSLFNSTVINGDSDENSAAFDGLDKALTGGATEYNASGSNVDLSAASIDSNYKTFLDKLDEFLLKLDGRPSVLIANGALIAKIRACLRRCGANYAPAEFCGGELPTYDGIPLIDAGKITNSSGTTADIIATTSGVTSLYAVRLGMDGLHGICTNSAQPVKVWLPDFKIAGAVKKGEVEMVAAIALKSTAAAGVFRKIKIA